jgi:hypothetical protein
MSRGQDHVAFGSRCTLASAVIHTTFQQRMPRKFHGRADHLPKPPVRFTIDLISTWGVIRQ